MENNKIPVQVYSQLKIIVRDAVKEAFEHFYNASLSESSLNNEEYLSAEQAAKYLKIKINTLYSKVEKGLLPYYRSGMRKLLFSKQELSDYINKRKG